MDKKYVEIINMPHHVSFNHPHMNNHDRAAQFAPFAALTGYDALIKEMARQTNKKITISKEKAEEISSKLTYLKERIKENIIISVVYFKKDKTKDGGAYLEIEGVLKSIDEYHKTIKIDNILIKINDIYDIDSTIFLDVMGLFI